MNMEGRPGASKENKKIRSVEQEWAWRELIAEEIDLVMSGKRTFADHAIEAISQYLTPEVDRSEYFAGEPRSELPIPNWATEDTMKQLALSEIENQLRFATKFVADKDVEASLSWIIGARSHMNHYATKGLIGPTEVATFEQRLTELENTVRD